MERSGYIGYQRTPFRGHLYSALIALSSVKSDIKVF